MSVRPADPPVVVVLPGGGGEPLAKALEAQLKASAPPATPAAHELWGEGEGEVTVRGEALPYKVKVEGLVLRHEDEGHAQVRVGVTSYVRPGASPAERPITFCFNGGPGSSSVWLHLGAFGPRRVVLHPELSPRPPYTLTDNAFTLFEESDLVFVDPPSTGWSRAQPGQDPKTWHGVTADVEAMSELIRLVLTRDGRWASPVFLAGESYGTTRVAAIALRLHERFGVSLSGLVLISCALDIGALEFHPGNDLPYVVILPTLAATAWYHLGREGDLAELLSEVEEFALEDYGPALMKGARLPADERRVIAERLSLFLGLSREYIERCDLRVSLERFVKELLRDRRRTVGRLDGRYVGVDRDGGGETFEYDPSFSAILGPYTAALHQHMHSLGVHREEEYRIITEKVNPWRWDGAENRALNVSESLRKVMVQQPHLKVFAASGVFDLATPFMATDHTFDHLALDGSLQDRIQHERYAAGHMMYVHEPCLALLKQHLRGFYARCLGAGE
ncbi:peptidase S10 [Myxococcota bacterium]|nr:peptidase S10 [Myxococcota bacterium]